MSDWTDTDWGATDPAGAWQHKYEVAAAEVESMRSRLADLEAERELIVARAENAEAALEESEARLAEADALLREESYEQYRFSQMTEYPSVTRMLLWHLDRKRRIDAHLSRKEK